VCVFPSFSLPLSLSLSPSLRVGNYYIITQIYRDGYTSTWPGNAVTQCSDPELRAELARFDSVVPMSQNGARSGALIRCCCLPRGDPSNVLSSPLSYKVTRKNPARGTTGFFARARGRCTLFIPAFLWPDTIFDAHVRSSARVFFISRSQPLGRRLSLAL